MIEIKPSDVILAGNVYHALDVPAKSIITSIVVKSRVYESVPTVISILRGTDGFYYIQDKSISVPPEIELKLYDWNNSIVPIVFATDKTLTDYHGYIIVEFWEVHLNSGEYLSTR